MSTHCSATFGSRESVSVGVSGKEEPDSCIWHNSSSVMMSNTASSGGRQSVLAPGVQRQVGREEKCTVMDSTGRECSYMGDEPPGHTLSAHSTDSYSVQMERNGSWDVPEKQMKGLQMKLNAPCKRFL